MWVELFGVTLLVHPMGFTASPNKLGWGGCLKYRDLVKLLEQDGWYLYQTTGSHRQYKHPTKPGRTTVAGHPGKDVPEGTLKSILRQSGLK